MRDAAVVCGGCLARSDIVTQHVVVCERAERFDHRPVVPSSKRNGNHTTSTTKAPKNAYAWRGSKSTDATWLVRIVPRYQKDHDLNTTQHDKKRSEPRSCPGEFAQKTHTKRNCMDGGVLAVPMGVFPEGRAERMDGVDATNHASMRRWETASTVGWEWKPPLEDPAPHLQFSLSTAKGWAGEWKARGSRRWDVPTATVCALVRD